MKLRAITGVAIAAALGGLFVVYRFSPSEYSFYPRCPFYAATHWLCPGCGSTRALHWLLHGDLATAMHYNAAFTLLAPFALAWLVYCCYRIMRYDRFPKLGMPRAAIVCVAVMTVLFTVARNTLFVF